MHLSSFISTNVPENWPQKTILVITKNSEASLKHWCLSKVRKQITLLLTNTYRIIYSYERIEQSRGPWITRRNNNRWNNLKVWEFLGKRERRVKEDTQHIPLGPKKNHHWEQQQGKQVLQGEMGLSSNCSRRLKEHSGKMFGT